MKPFCMLLYNLMQVVQGYVAQSQSCEPTEISSELMFRDVEDQLIAWETFGRRLRRGQETRTEQRPTPNRDPRPTQLSTGGWHIRSSVIPLPLWGRGFAAGAS